MTELAAAVAGYARRMHGALGDGHHVASPLGAWLVLALAGSAARDAEAEELGATLGMPVGEASAAAAAVLDRPHPEVLAAAAAWTQPAPVELAGPAAAWLGGLPHAVEKGPIPLQADADAWARDRTLGLVEAFPLNLTDWTTGVLASALATRIAWSVPFGTVGSDAFRSEWCAEVSRVLATPAEGHACAIVRHADAGDLAVHRAHSDHLSVTSVIGAEDVPAQKVLAAAHDVADDRSRRISLFDLPLGDGPSWTITERDGVGGEERFSAVLPAWSARSRHDLTAPPFGFGPAASALMRLLHGTLWDAAQAAVARYDRTGFEAAAVTALAVDCSYRMPTPGRERAARLRFDRPYAVVATAYGRGAWDRLPVFSAWVTEPEEP